MKIDRSITVFSFVNCMGKFSEFFYTLQIVKGYKRCYFGRVCNTTINHSISINVRQRFLKIDYVTSLTLLHQIAMMDA